MIKRRSFYLAAFALVTVTLPGVSMKALPPMPGQLAQSLEEACGLTALWNLTINPGFPSQAAFESAIEQSLQRPTCFQRIQISSVPSSGMDALTKPFHQNLFAAFQNYSTQQQQASSNTTGGSTSPVSKVTGPTAIGQEFGGLNITSGTSALTFQFAAATLLQNLSAGEVVSLCSPVLVAHDCISRTGANIVSRFTLGVTANTSNSSQTVSGTASSTSSSSRCFLSDRTIL